MGKRTGNDRKIGRKFWGFIGALWLVMVCLAGCAVPGKAARDSGTVQISGEIEESRDQESGSDVGDSPGEEGNDERERSDAEEPDIKSDKESEIESGMGTGEKSDAWSDTKSETGAGTESDTSSDVKSTMALEDAQSTGNSAEGERTDGTIEKSAAYTSKDEVALYLHVYGCLPDNYITKREAEDLGWNSKEGNLWDVAPGMSIGGSRFGNYEGALPDKKGRKYFECDIDYEGGYRGAKRLIYSDDGLIFYTEDHYNTFEQLYGQ